MDEKDKELIYHFRSTLESALASLKNADIDEENRELIAGFSHDALARGLAPSNVLKYVSQLKTFAKLLGKPFPKATKHDLINVVGTLETMAYTRHSKRTMKTNLKLFYRWLRGREEFPEEVRWLKPGRARNSITPGDLLTNAEVERMVDAATSLRDKTLIAVTYESACRPQEILPLRLKQVRFDSYGVLVTVHGKIGVQRSVRLLASVPLLSTWLNIHPRKSDPEAPLFPNFQRNAPYRFLTYASFSKIIKGVVKKAGIAKRVYPYLFRHSRLTELARIGFTGYQFNLFAGWTLDSRMASTYIHLLSKDVDDAILRLNGIVKDGATEPTFAPVLCPRCKQKNTPGMKLCLICGSALDLQSAIELDHTKLDIKTKIDVLSEELAKSPEVLDTLLEALASMKKSSRTT